MGQKLEWDVHKFDYCANPSLSVSEGSECCSHNILRCHVTIFKVQ